MRAQMMAAGLFALLALAGCSENNAPVPMDTDTGPLSNEQAPMDTGVSTTSGVSSTILGAPQGLVVNPQVGAIALQWQAVSGAAGYRLYWANTPGVGTDSASIDLGNQTQYTLIASPGVVYYLRVAAVDGDGVASLGNEVMSQAALPAAPKGSDSAP